MQMIPTVDPTEFCVCAVPSKYPGWNHFAVTVRRVWKRDDPGHSTWTVDAHDGLMSLADAIQAATKLAVEMRVPNMAAEQMHTAAEFMAWADKQKG